VKLGRLPVFVDEFESPGQLYFLSHFHRDHMDGLAEGWSRGRLVCSRITANLLSRLEGIDPQHLQVLEPGEDWTFRVGRQRLLVQALAANHCPGSLMFIFRFDGTKIAYTGDFRISDPIRGQADLLMHPDVLYIDSTYAEPGYQFPTLESSIAQILDIIRRHDDKDIYLALYTIGKTRIVEAIFEEFSQPVYVTKAKLEAYAAMGLEDLVTPRRNETRFIGYSRQYIDRYFSWKGDRHPDSALVIYPSGWAVDQPQRKGFFYVPYSEHCDYPEYQEFIAMTHPQKVVQI